MNGSRGFTLMEILVALAVVGIALAALLGASARATRDAAELRDRTYANWVAQNVLTEIRISREALESGTQRGTEVMGGETWEWTADINAAAVPSLRHILIHVGRENVEGSIVTMSAFRLAQPQMEASVVPNAPGERSRGGDENPGEDESR